MGEPIRPAEPSKSLNSPFSIFVSGLLVAFTLLVGIACIIALASTLTQSRILSLNFDGVQASIWKLDSVRRDWSELRGRNLKQTGALQAATTEKLELNDQQAAASQRLNQYKEQLFVRLAEIAARIKETDGPLHDAIGGDADLKTRAAALAAAESRLRTNLPDLGPILDNFGKERQQYSEALTKMSDLDSQSSSLAQKQKYLAQGLLEIGKNIDVVFSQITKNVDAPTHAKIENALYELDPSSGWFSLIINRFVILQPDVLALVLVVLMGLLGSSLQILHSLFRAHRIESPGDYILQLSVGAITALVIFIVAKAGVPIIADASRLSGDAPINPYFVSFLAIISGLLSEQAIITVQNQGRRIFATGKAEPDRWVRVSLDPTLNDQNLTVEQLASYLSVPTDAANSIIKGESKADAEQQKAIAIFLRKSVRDLFTDMPPANVSDS